MEYISELIWYGSWPVVVFIALKFVQLNIKHLDNMERLEQKR
jgi:uncharacterized membrane protein